MKRNSSKKWSAFAAKPKTTVAKTATAKETTPVTNTATNTTSTATRTGTALGTTSSGSTHRDEAKSRFNAAVQEAKAGAAALKAEASERAGIYRDQAKAKRGALASDAKSYGDEARLKGKDLAIQGKGKLAEGINALSRTVSDNAHVVDENLGAKYGDYARSASKTLADTATKLDQKSVEELAEDGRAMVRKSPGMAIGIAAAVGFMLSRLLGGGRR